MHVSKIDHKKRGPIKKFIQMKDQSNVVPADNNESE